MAPKRIAVIATIYRYLSHAQHFADRFIVGYPYEGRWHRPDTQIVSLYVDQKPEGDQSADRAREFGFSLSTRLSLKRCVVVEMNSLSMPCCSLVSMVNIREMKKVRFSTHATNSSRSVSKSLKRTVTLCRSTMTNISPTILRRRRRW